MEHNTLFKLIYTFILGVILALFLGVGVQAFYEPPTQPEYPVYDMPYKEGAQSPEQQKAFERDQQRFDKELRAYEDVRQMYERNVSVILLILAVITVAIGIVFSRQIGFLSDGILLGGLFTLVHALIRGFAADDSKYLFVAAAVAVVVVLYLGYRRFGSVAETSTKRKK